MLVYSIARPVSNQKFTDFYILGINGKADDYPSEFGMVNDIVTYVKYGNEGPEVVSGWGDVVIGIGNHENQTSVYSVKVTIDGELVNFDSYGGLSSLLGPIELGDAKGWEQKIGIAPQHIGNGQKVEFMLYKDGNSDPYRVLDLWIDVKQV